MNTIVGDVVWFARDEVRTHRCFTTGACSLPRANRDILARSSHLPATSASAPPRKPPPRARPPTTDHHAITQTTARQVIKRPWLSVPLTFLHLFRRVVAIYTVPPATFTTLSLHGALDSRPSHHATWIDSTQSTPSTPTTTQGHTTPPRLYPHTTPPRRHPGLHPPRNGSASGASGRARASAPSRTRRARHAIIACATARAARLTSGSARVPRARRCAGDAISALGWSGRGHGMRGGR